MGGHSAVCACSAVLWYMNTEKVGGGKWVVGVGGGYVRVDGCVCVGVCMVMVGGRPV